MERYFDGPTILEESSIINNRLIHDNDDITEHLKYYRNHHTRQGKTVRYYINKEISFNHTLDDLVSIDFFTKADRIINRKEKIEEFLL